MLPFVEETPEPVSLLAPLRGGGVGRGDRLGPLNDLRAFAQGLGLRRLPLRREGLLPLGDFAAQFVNLAPERVEIPNRSRFLKGVIQRGEPGIKVARGKP